MHMIGAETWDMAMDGARDGAEMWGMATDGARDRTETAQRGGTWAHVRGVDVGKMCASQ